VVGVAGAGKTTALAAVREAFEAEGFEVIGTSMSGRPSGPTRWKTVEAGSWRT
jgi:thymidylate kinase